jgi:cation transport protein ChaC
VAHIDRDAIKNGFFQNMAKEAHEKGLIELTSAEARERCWRKMLATNPNTDGSVWVFAYGSLLWNPAFHLVDQTDAKLYGYHRDFCLRTYIGRGSEEQPGLVLGLEAGGHCQGRALRVDPCCIEEEIDLLWSREMLSSAYQPHWLTITTDKEQPIFAIAFVMDRQSRQYAGALSFAERCHDLAHGKGALGSAADYLFETVSALNTMGIEDSLLNRYKDKVNRITAQTTESNDAEGS